MISPLDLSRAGGRSGARAYDYMRWTIQRLRLTVSTATCKTVMSLCAGVGRREKPLIISTNAGSSEVIQAAMALARAEAVAPTSVLL